MKRMFGFVDEANAAPASDSHVVAKASLTILQQNKVAELDSTSEKDSMRDLEVAYIQTMSWDTSLPFPPVAH